MNYSSSGLSIFGTGTFTCESAKERIPRAGEAIFHTPATGWRDSTLGVLAEAKPQPGEAGWAIRQSQHELAFFILSQYPRYKDNTECQVGRASTMTAIRVGDIEFRSKNSTLYPMRVAK
jgi:hypothetical protein